MPQGRGRTAAISCRIHHISSLQGIQTPDKWIGWAGTGILFFPVYFYICVCQLKEKTTFTARLNISPYNIRVLHSGGLQCQEQQTLDRSIHGFIFQRETGTNCSPLCQHQVSRQSPHSYSILHLSLSYILDAKLIAKLHWWTSVCQATFYSDIFEFPNGYQAVI